MSIKICGLLGKTLKHSYSPQIHDQLNKFISEDDKKYTYDLIELEADEVGTFLTNAEFHALNVTIPYKQTVIPFCSELSDTAQKVGCVNTITRLSDGKLRGDNTDYYGFCYMLDKADIDVTEKKVMIIGNGGSSLTARAVLEDKRAGNVVIISRSDNNPEILSKHTDTEIIINTSPVGMYPNTGISPVDLSMFPKLLGVADIIYNPSKTQFLLDAEKRNIPCINGLSMLVAQAKLASEKFVNCEIEISAIDKITATLENQMKNIILIGMPGSGKTSVGIVIAEKLGRNFIDTDDMIIQSVNKPIPEIFAESGEEMFRQYETNAITEAGKLSSHVIATGGGIITRERNIDPLRQNSIIFFLNRDIDSLPTDGRPLSKNIDAIKKLYIERLPLYRQYCDYEIDGNGSIEETTQKILQII